MSTDGRAASNTIVLSVLKVHKRKAMLMLAKQLVTASLKKYRWKQTH